MHSPIERSPVPASPPCVRCPFSASRSERSPGWRCCLPSGTTTRSVIRALVLSFRKKNSTTVVGAVERVNNRPRLFKACGRAFRARGAFRISSPHEQDPIVRPACSSTGRHDPQPSASSAGPTQADTHGVRESRPLALKQANRGHIACRAEGGASQVARARASTSGRLRDLGRPRSPAVDLPIQLAMRGFVNRACTPCARPAPRLSTTRRPA
jgi:hypothetical protein